MACTHEFGARMLDQGHGAIVNIGSTVIVRGSARAPQYAAAKYGILGLTKSYAHAFAPTVRVNVFAPGFIETEATLARDDWKGGRGDELRSKTPMGRIPGPDGAGRHRAVPRHRRRLAHDRRLHGGRRRLQHGRRLMRRHRPRDRRSELGAPRGRQGRAARHLRRPSPSSARAAPWSRLADGRGRRRAAWPGPARRPGSRPPRRSRSTEHLHRMTTLPPADRGRLRRRLARGGVPGRRRHAGPRRRRPGHRRRRRVRRDGHAVLPGRARPRGLERRRPAGQPRGPGHRLRPGRALRRPARRRPGALGGAVRRRGQDPDRRQPPAPVASGQRAARARRAVALADRVLAQSGAASGGRRGGRPPRRARPAGRGGRRTRRRDVRRRGRRRRGRAVRPAERRRRPTWSAATGHVLPVPGGRAAPAACRSRRRRWSAGSASPAPTPAPATTWPSRPHDDRMTVRICVVGCGAIGSLYAAHLARLDDVEVWAVDPWAEHVAAIDEHGLRVTGRDEFVAPVHARTTAADVPPCDLGIVATKAEHTRAAVAACADVFADAAVASVQNGLGNEEVLAELVPRVIRGTILPAGAVTAPGVVRYDAPGDTWLGPFEPQPASMDEVDAARRPAHQGRAAHATRWRTPAGRSGTRSSSTRPPRRWPRSPGCRWGRSAPTRRCGSRSTRWSPRRSRSARRSASRSPTPVTRDRRGDRGRPRPQAVDAAGRAGAAAHRGRRAQRRHRRAGPAGRRTDPAARRDGRARARTRALLGGDLDEAGDLRRRAASATLDGEDGRRARLRRRRGSTSSAAGDVAGDRRAAARSPTSGCGRRSCRRSSSTPPATSPTTTRSCRPSTGRTRCTRASCSSRTSTRSSARTTTIVYPEGLTKELDYELELARRHRQVRQVLRAGRGRRRTSPATRSSTTSPRATSSAARWSRGSSRSPRRSTRSARSARGSSPPTRSPDPHDAGDGAAGQRRGAPAGQHLQTLLLKLPHLVAHHSPQGYSRRRHHHHRHDLRAWPRSSRTRSTSTSSPATSDRGRDRGRRHAAQPRRGPWKAAHDTEPYTTDLYS